MNQASPVNPEIRPMRESDLDQVIRIERQIFLFPWSPANFSDSLQAGYLCRVMEENLTILGYSILMIGPDEAHILTLGINPDWQRRGLGEKMLHYLIARREVGIARCARIESGCGQTLSATGV
jgi:ribosomal-protein-alanine N-acetyltransferase